MFAHRSRRTSRPRIVGGGTQGLIGEAAKLGGEATRICSVEASRSCLTCKHGNTEASPGTSNP